MQIPAEAMDLPAVRINNLVKLLLELINDQKEEEVRLRRAVAAATSERADARQHVEYEIQETKGLLYELIISEKHALFATGKRSFDSYFGSISLRDTPGSTKAKDAKRLLALARKHGMVRKLFTVKVGWNFSITKFKAWAEKFPERAVPFYEFLEVHERHDALSLKPHVPHLKELDLDRISAEPISLELS